MKIQFAKLSNIVTDGIINLFYPPRCAMCRESLAAFNKGILCKTCYNNIEWNKPPFCLKCGKSLLYESGDSLCGDCIAKTYYFDRTYAVCVYEGVIRECIHSFKYSAKLSLERLFKELIIEFAEKNMQINRYDWVVAVPLHAVKQRERTFNQSQILASFISNRFGLPMLKNNLLRIRPGKPQMTLPKNERLKHIKNSFKIMNPSTVKDRAFLLIDDVFTTGATVDECAKALKKAGANLVEVLTLAKGA